METLDGWWWWLFLLEDSLSVCRIEVQTVYTLDLRKLSVIFIHHCKQDLKSTEVQK